MPRIRKETSNRRSTNDRAKKRKQVKETKRKSAKAAKKNPQWKSKTPKDPGIPSEFPYKDQILAEVAEQRRIAAEEKERKKEEKQRNLARARAIARGEPVDEDSDAGEAEASDNGEAEEEDIEVDEATGKPKSKKDLNVGAESIASLSAKLVGTKIKARPKPAPEVVEDEGEEDEVPVLINRDLPNLKAVLEKADVMVELLDGRDPIAFRSKHIEELAQEMGKKVLFVVNKIDTCPREALAQWSTQLRNQHPTLLFRSASYFLPVQPVQVDPQIKKDKGKAPKVRMDNAVGADSVLACLAHWAKEKKGEEPLAVAIVGVTNVGKSAFVNSLLKRSALPVYTLASSSRGPTTTELPQEVALEIEDQKILVIDTPGLSFLSSEEDEVSVIEDRRARDILLRSKGRIDRLKDPNPPIAQIVSRANAEDLMLLYSLPAFLKGDSTAFLSGVARANQLIKKKGELDLTGAARIVLRDWSVGKLAHYTTPPANLTTTSLESTDPTSDAFLTELYAKDEAILASLPTRKEKRKEGGLVKVAPGSADERKVAVEADWAGLEASEDEETDDDEHEGLDAEVMDVDSEEEDKEEEEEASDEHDKEEEEEEVVPPSRSNKQKRKRVVEAAAARPAKKVAFAAAASSKNPRSGSKPIAASSAQPLNRVQAPAKKHDAKKQDKPVSVLKTAAKAKAAPTKASAGTGAAKNLSENNVKVANKPSTKTTASDTKKDGNAPEAYDFGKFF